MSIKDQQLSDKLDEITSNDEWSINRKRVEAGKAVRETITRLHDEGKTVEEIVELTGLRQSRVEELVKS
jgi:hypothetical protein